MKTRSSLYIALLLLCCCLTACDPIKYDYISKYCPGSCTVIKGRISDQDGVPVAGVQLEANWNKPNYPLGGSTRHKAIATTDANGNYELRFLLRDQELTEGYISVEPEAELDAYLSCSGNNRWYGNNLSRDTTIIQNYTVAPAATLRLVLNSEEPDNQQNRILTTLKYKLSASDADSCTYVYDSRRGDSSEPILIPADTPVVLYTETIKNSSRNTQKDTLNLEEGELREYQLSF